MPPAVSDRPEPSTGEPLRRDVTIDVARGLAIVAIVLGHVLRGIGGTGLIDPDSDLAGVLDRTLYLFHLAVFAFLSGLFVSRTVEARGRRSFVRHRVLGFLYLYLVWSVLQGAVKLATGSVVNQPTDLADVANLLAPEGQLWFLPWLMIASLVSVAVRPWRTRLRATVTLIVAGVLAVVAWGTDYGVVGGQGLALYVFYFAGEKLGAARLSAAFRGSSILRLVVAAVIPTAVLLLVGIGTRATVPTSYFDVRTAGTVALGIAGAVAGVLAVLAVSGLIAKAGAVAAPIAFVGRYSLEIFLAHIIFAAGARIVLGVLGVDDVVVVVALALVVGIAGPVVLAIVLRRLRFPWLFVMPGEKVPAQPVRLTAT